MRLGAENGVERIRWQAPFPALGQQHLGKRCVTIVDQRLQARIVIQF